MFDTLLSFISNIDESVSSLLKASQGLPFLLIVMLAFLGGLAASLSPCILPCIPLYVSYTGVTEITSKLDALKKSALFGFGAALIFGLLGGCATFAGLVVVEYRGVVNIIIGLFIILMCLLILEVIKFPLPQLVKNIPNGGPFLVGAAFALVSSPCASPILFAVLALVSTAGSFLKSTLIMLAYSIGYTGLIFLASLSVGLVKQLKFLKLHSRMLTIVSSIILALLGIFYLYSGITWFFN